MSDRERREALIQEWLKAHPDPVRGEDLAQKLGVTRQVVVHEIALLRAKGVPILSTPRGYILWQNAPSDQRTVISVRHDPEQTREELYTLVDHGLVVANVIVEHPLYGELVGNLNLRSRRDVDDFCQAVAQNQAALLSSLTHGYHLHTVAYRHPEDLEAAVRTMRQRGIEVFD
ncbi:MAG: transcription repressor NadR [Firmicutes bacterium]|nr:transcription repressor NadR [Bacillota bacterium]